jgi:hypothetical protein
MHLSFNKNVVLFSELLNLINDKTSVSPLWSSFSGISLAILDFEIVSKTYLKNPRELNLTFETLQVCKALDFSSRL